MTGASGRASSRDPPRQQRATQPNPDTRHMASHVVYKFALMAAVVVALAPTTSLCQQSEPLPEYGERADYVEYEEPAEPREHHVVKKRGVIHDGAGGQGVGLDGAGYGGGYSSGYGGGYGGGYAAGAVPISEHVEVERPVPVPVVKTVEVKVPHPVPVAVPHPVAVAVPQPYPVPVEVPQPIAVPVVRTVAIPVEKPVPVPVERHVPVPVERPYPVHIEKHVPVPVPRPYAVTVPVVKHIHHYVKHGGWH